MKVLAVVSSFLHTLDFFVFLLQISVDRGMPWEEAYNRSLKLTGPDEGFYLSHKVGSPASFQIAIRV